MKIMIAMSGGVDSSVAAALLKQQGHDLIGVTMKVWKHQSALYDSFDDELNDARNIARKLDFPHYLVDLSKDFTNVVDDFKNQYLKGQTPNPCVLCNRTIKFGKLVEFAEQLGCEAIATGHYAKIGKKNNRYFLQKGKDLEKDQTYFMWGIGQESLAKAIFPLGNYNKQDIKKLADKLGFKKQAYKKESYDICFTKGMDYREFLQEHIHDLNERVGEGYFIDTEGNNIGKHKGYPFYTIGQRKGLDIAMGKPFYVKKIHPQSNEVELAERKYIETTEFFIKDIVMSKYEIIPDGFEVKVKIRYKNKNIDAELFNEPHQMKVKLREPVFAVTPGQSAVFYEGDDVIAGGIIV